MLCSEYPPELFGGIGALTQNLARGYVANGHEVTVLGTYGNIKTPIIENDQGVRVVRLRKGQNRFSPHVDRYRIYCTAKEILRDRQIDIIETPDFEGPVAFWPALDVPVVSRLSGTFGYFADEMK